MQQTNKKLKIAVGIFAGILAVILIAGLVLNISLLTKVNAQGKLLNSTLNKNGGETTEDGVIIADEYEIKSTKNISDAYKSGDRSDLSDKDKETLDMASKILDEIIDKDMSDYEKELAVYDWMTANLDHDTGSYLVIPNTQEDCDNPYGVLKYHNAVCVGYATTFRLFMQMLDIDCMVVHNTECYHSWNLVKLDGEWYHTDIYSDVGSGNYSHFNRNDAMCATDQSWDTSYFPAANGIKYNHAYSNLKTCDDIYDLPAALRDMIDEQCGSAAFAFKTEIGEPEAAIVNEIMSDIEMRLMNSDEYGYLTLYWNWYKVQEGYVLFLTIDGFDYNDDDPDIDDPIDIPSDAYDKIYDAIEKSFGDIEVSDVDNEDGDDDVIIGARG